MDTQNFKLFREINFLIYQAVLEFFKKSDVEILKMRESYSFSITYPNDSTGSIYLMIANFPEENGFVQTQIIDDRSPLNYNLSIINNYSDLLKLIIEFTKVYKRETLDISLDSDDSNHSDSQVRIESSDYLDAEDCFKNKIQEIKKLDLTINEIIKKLYVCG